MNKNVNWLGGAGVWPAYLGIIVFFRCVLFLLGSSVTVLSSETQWTLTNVAHGVVRALAAKALSARAAAARPPGERALHLPALPLAPPPWQFTFLSFHFNRGSPLWEDQGVFIDRTFWEQIDNGVPWTRNRKFLFVVPIALCVLRSGAHMAASAPPLAAALFQPPLARRARSPARPPAVSSSSHTSRTTTRCTSG